ncbi:MAG: hypothetical protein LUE99_06105 [Bacteroides sp.]|nr:hypothetical protein [Bacteroides sp.]
MNGEGFSDLFDILISSGQLSEFVKQWYLVKVRHIVGLTPELSTIRIKMNDYAQDELGQLMQSGDLMADLVDSYLKKAAGKKMIVFAVNVGHSRQIVDEYCRAGARAEHIDANTPKKEREHILRMFKKGKITVLSNVDIVSEGFDAPDCEVVQLARPTKSLALYLQQVGRCMRPAQGKKEGIVLDNAGLWLEYGFCQQDRIWTLEGKKRKNRCNMPLMVAAKDSDGAYKEIHIPLEIKGMELVELTAEIEDLFAFEDFLKSVIVKEQKPVRAYCLFEEYMERKRHKLNMMHIYYIRKRLEGLYNAPQKGLWYHVQQKYNLV